MKAEPVEESVLDTGGTDRRLLSFFIPDLTLGGAEKVTIGIANGLADRGYEIELVVSRFEGELKSQLKDGIKVVELPPSGVPVLGLVANLPALAAYLRRRKPSVLFCHLAHVSVVALVVDRFLDTETLVVPVQHNAFGIASDPTLKDRIVDRLVPHLYPAADRIVAVSEGVADGLVERTSVERKDISVLHNPIDVETVRESAGEPVDHEWFEDDRIDVVLFVGRLEKEKDLATWLRTFELVHDRNPHARAVIIGEGSCRRDLESLADELGIADLVSMPGYDENPYRYMQRADVFLLSSQYEGLPTVLIEALACGCPVVATDCPSGPREILAGGEYGRLAPVGDAAGLADAVVSTLAEPVPGGKLRERADLFAPASVLDEYEAFLRKHADRSRE